jgi:hypothetical protein
VTNWTGIPASTVPGEAVAATDQAPTVEITTSTDLFWRRAAGRIDAGQFLAGGTVVGDADLARALAEALRIMI